VISSYGERYTLLLTYFRARARLPALYSDFRSQRTLNPDGYEANVSTWRRALASIARSGLAPSTKAAATNVLVLDCDDRLPGALESKQYGRPLALGAVVAEALSEKELMPLRDFLKAKESIYSRKWGVSPWAVASWVFRQLGVTDNSQGSDRIPKGQLVVLANVEMAAKGFGDKITSHASRFERTFSKAHFYKTFADQLIPGSALSETDVSVLLTFLSRDKGVLLYDGAIVKVKAPGVEETALTEEDASIAQLKELLEYLDHQTTALNKRIEELARSAKDAVAKKNRVIALAALRSKKLAESSLEKRLATLGQLEEVAAKIEQASDNVQLVKVMESSGEALRALNSAVGGAERVEDVVDRLREQVGQADEVTSILAEGGAVVDEGEIDDELERLEGEERRVEEEKERVKAEEERSRVEAQQQKEAEEMKKRLEAIEAPKPLPESRNQGEGERTDRSPEPLLDEAAEGLRRMSLMEPAQAQPDA
jgi:charged multivesicular body protein 7